MLMKNWKWLQLFAEGAAGGGEGGGEGASAPVASEGVDDGHQRLRELGVPENKIRKNRAYKLPPRPAQASAKAEPQGQAQAAAVDDTKPTEGSRMSWEQIMADPEYNKKMQETMKARLSKSGKELEDHGKMADAHKALARYYGLDPENIDYAQLAQKVQGDDGLVENRALQNGVDTAVQRKLDEYEAMKAQQQMTSQQQARQQMLDAHYQGLQQQAEKLKAIVPGFDLDAEIANNPEFKRLVGPGVRVPVEMAYKLCHQDEIINAAISAAQKKTAQMMSNAIQSNASRPEESGSSGQAPSVSTFDWRNASKEQRAAHKKRILEAGARGEYIYPGR